MFRRLFCLITVTAVTLLVAAVEPGLAQTATAEIVEQLDDSGRYLEFSADNGIDDAIAGVNRQGAAFAWLDTDADAEGFARDLVAELNASGSRYKTVLVLTNSGIWAESFEADVGPAASASLEDFSRGAVADGLDTFSTTLSGGTTATTTGGSNSQESDGSSNGSGGLPGWLWGIVAAGAAFVGIRIWSGKRKTKKAEADLLELDRLEIKEQLKDNADRVIELGDKAIASGDPDLTRTYEQASKAYTEVSTEIDNVTTVVEMDRLDDRLDHAEWQFEVIEAKLDGRTPPALPGPDNDDARPGPTTPATADAGPPSMGTRNNRPALGPDESVFGGRGPGETSRRPRSGGLGRGRARSGMGRRRGGLSGGLGGMGGGLGGILGSIILGGGLGSPRTSRRSQRRRASTGSFGGLGGGVLRPRGGGSRGGGGSFGGRSSRGGGGRF